MLRSAGRCASQDARRFPAATLLLMPLAALLGVLYGYIVYAGYHKGIHLDDAER
jgi:hypothetical protein